MLQRDANGDILFKASWGERLIQLSIVLIVSFFISLLNYKIDNIYTINCTPDNFCKDYYCEYLHQIFCQSDSDSNLLFTDDTLLSCTINQIPPNDGDKIKKILSELKIYQEKVEKLNANNDLTALLEELSGYQEKVGRLNNICNEIVDYSKGSHIIKKASHNITSKRVYDQFTNACECASLKARKSLKMTYPKNPYVQLKEDPAILNKIKNAGRNKVSKKKFIYISSSDIDYFCKKIYKDYLDCKKGHQPNQNLKEPLKTHPLYQYISAHKNYKELRWIKRDENKEVFIADDNIALFFNRDENKMEVELRKAVIKNAIHETSSQSTKDFFKELMPEIIKQLNGSTNKKDIREIKYCLRVTNSFENLFIK